MNKEEIYHSGKGIISYYLKEDVNEDLGQFIKEVKNSGYREVFSEEENEKFQQALGRYENEEKNASLSLRRVHDVVVTEFYRNADAVKQLGDNTLWELDMSKGRPEELSKFDQSVLGRDRIFFGSIQSEPKEDIQKSILKSHFGKNINELTKEYFQDHALFHLEENLGRESFLLIYDRGNEEKADECFDRFFIPFRTFSVKIRKSVRSALNYCSSLDNFLNRLSEGSIILDREDLENYNDNLDLLGDVKENADKNLENMSRVNERVEERRKLKDYQKFFRIERLKDENLVSKLNVKLDRLKDDRKKINLEFAKRKKREEVEEKVLSPLLPFIESDEVREGTSKNLNKWRKSNFRRHLWGHDPNPLFVDHGFRHIQNVQNIASKILEKYQSDDRLKLKDNELKLLIYAIWLHDIGMGGDFIEEDKRVIRKKHAKFSAFRIKGERNFLGLEGEAFLVAKIALYHSSKTALTEEYKNNVLAIGEDGKGKNPLVERVLKPESYKGQEIRLPLLSAILRLSDCLDIGRERAINTNREELLNNTITRLDKRIMEAEGVEKEKLRKRKKEFHTTWQHVKIHQSIKKHFEDNKVVFEIMSLPIDMKREKVEKFVQNIIGEDWKASMSVLNEHGITDFKFDIQ